MKPIPAQLLKSNATLKVCTGVDRFQKQTYTTYDVSRVHLQPTNEVRKTQNNTEVVLRSILFVDARITAPVLDWMGLFSQAHAAGGDMIVTIDNVDYTVYSVDTLRDDRNKIHHWELGLV